MTLFYPIKQWLIAAILFAGINCASISENDNTLALTDLSFVIESNIRTGSYQFDNNDPIVKSDSADCIIPFSRAGNLIIIKAKADNIEGNFILDTGAPGLILNMTYFRDYPITEIHSNEQGGGITGSVGGYGKTKVAKLSFGPIRYSKVNTDLINLGHIENSKGIKIIGLLGVQLFKQFEMIIDYENSQIHLHLINSKEAKKYQNSMLGDTAAYSVFPLDLLENKMITYGKIGNKKLTFLIDTGAETNVIDSRLSESVLGNVVITRRLKLNGSGNKKVDALYGDMSNLTIGSRNIATMPVLVTNMAKMCFSYERCLDGMLGFDFLSMHKIGFNFVKRKMYIWK
ncbi:MAG TPA: pepsin/retropepsin-like aspartic protease family protein [Ferruginibacter sp.]|nr:pepsin/retropepsin-like aspartic protease family protein [Ferruginibacter sp.]